MVKHCKICGREDNRIQIRAGSGLCCNICEKIEKEDIEILRALDYLWSINTKRADATFEALERKHKVTFLHTQESSDAPQA